MNKNSTAVNLFLAAALLFPTLPPASAATDGVYALSETAFKWEGTAGNRLPTPTENYDYAYGDESSVSFTLPWQFPFYGQQYGSINVDTNGNIRFSSAGAAHSFDLAVGSGGPVISAWNSDLSSYFYGGAFIQRKTDPERVVIEWQAETFTEEGYYRPNKLEAVLFSNGDIRFDYANFSTETGRDFGSGISQADGTHSLSVTETYGKAYTLAQRSFLFSPNVPVPVGTMVINNGAAVTSNTTVNLSLTCTVGGSDCASMQFSRDNVVWSSPVPFSQAHPFTLSGVNGVKTVFVKFISQSGIAADPISSSITFDTRPPVVTASLLPGTYTGPRKVVIVSNEPAKIYYGYCGNIPTLSSPIYSIPLNFTNSNCIRYFAVDTAGNKSGVFSSYLIRLPALRKLKTPRFVLLGRPIAVETAGNRSQSVTRTSGIRMPELKKSKPSPRQLPSPRKKDSRKHQKLR